MTNEYLEKFFRLNPHLKANQKIVHRADGRLEWICEHGVGHTIYSNEAFYIHGCDGCCKNIRIPQLEEIKGKALVEKAQRFNQYKKIFKVEVSDESNTIL